MMAQRHVGVERVPSRHDIGDAGVERDPVQRRMRLDESAVALFGELVVHEVMRHRHVVQPRREPPERIRQLRRLKN